MRRTFKAMSARLKATAQATEFWEGDKSPGPCGECGKTRKSAYAFGTWKPCDVMIILTLGMVLGSTGLFGRRPRNPVVPSTRKNMALGYITIRSACTSYSIYLRGTISLRGSSSYLLLPSLCLRNSWVSRSLL